MLVWGRGGDGVGEFGMSFRVLLAPMALMWALHGCSDGNEGAGGGDGGTGDGGSGSDAGYAGQSLALVSRTDGGAAGGVANSPPHASADGRWVVFSSATDFSGTATGGVRQAYLADAATGTITLLSATPEGAAGNGPSSFGKVSDDGQVVAFVSAADDLAPADEDGANDVFVLDRGTGELLRLSVWYAVDEVETTAEAYAPFLSGDGRIVAFSFDHHLDFDGDAALTDVFVFDLTTSSYERISQASATEGGNGNSFVTDVSRDGRFVVFQSDATNLGGSPGHTTRDVFVKDRVTGELDRVSVGSGGVESDGPSHSGVISDDGRYVAFVSEATNLVVGDTNGLDDVFLHDRQLGVTTRVSVRQNGTQTVRSSRAPSISGDGRCVSFITSGGLVLDDVDGQEDVYCVDFAGGTVQLLTGWAMPMDVVRGQYLASDGEVLVLNTPAPLVAEDTNTDDDTYRVRP